MYVFIVIIVLFKAFIINMWWLPPPDHQWLAIWVGIMQCFTLSSQHQVEDIQDSMFERKKGCIILNSEFIYIFDC